MNKDIPPDNTTTAFLGRQEPKRRGSANHDACLIVIQGPNIGKRIVLGKGDVVLGRAKDADAQINEDSVSRIHAIIRKEEERFLIEDQHSKNGTFINGVRQVASELKDQDLIAIGGSTFKFLASDSPELEYHEELHKLAALDPMLQVYNKRIFLERLEENLRRTPSNERPFSIILLDIDHFKLINDGHGHQAGDRVLQQVANTVKALLRGGDLLSRYGGEEFAIILPDTDLLEAGRVAEKLRQAVQETVIDHESTEIRATISLGTASSNPGDAHTATAQALIERADSALYRAKKAGRNRVMAAAGADGRA